MLLNERRGLPRQMSAAEFYIRSAAATIFGPSRKARAGGLWAMLSAYFDESGTHQGSPICVVAGLLASPLQWERLTASWAKTLAQAGVSDFHASDCVTGGGCFKGWERTEREKLYGRFVKIVTRFAAYRIWTALVMDDFHLHYQDKEEKRPYRICAFGCASRVKAVASKRGPAFDVDYIFDQGPKGKWTYAAFDRLLDQGRGSHYYRMGTLAKGDRLKMLPLQAADLHAYEVFRYFADQWKTHRHEARPEFRELLNIPDAGGYIMTGEYIDLLGTDLRRQAREGRDEPIAIPVFNITRDSGVKLIKLPEGE